MIRITPVTVADRDPIARLVQRQANFTAAEKVVAMEVVDAGLTIPGEGYWLKKAVRSGSLAGFICYGPIPLTDNRFDLYWIAVDPAHRRRGVADLLMEAMEADLASYRPAQVYIDTSSTPAYAAARALYEKHGYTVAAVLPDFYRAGDSKLIYWKTLP